MRIAIGSDHRGVNLKQEVARIITGAGHSFEDFGSYNTDPVDYPDIALKVGEAVTKQGFDRGILICDTGIGMSIAANKIKGIRAALCYDAFCALRARLHNDANVLVLGGGRKNEDLADIITNFLTVAFEGGRHQQRLDKMKELES